MSVWIIAATSWRCPDSRTIQPPALWPTITTVRLESRPGSLDARAIAAGRRAAGAGLHGVDDLVQHAAVLARGQREAVAGDVEVRALGVAEAVVGVDDVAGARERARRRPRRREVPVGRRGGDAVDEHDRRGAGRDGAVGVAPAVEHARRAARIGHREAHRLGGHALVEAHLRLGGRAGRGREGQSGQDRQGSSRELAHAVRLARAGPRPCRTRPRAESDCIVAVRSHADRSRDAGRRGGGRGARRAGRRHGLRTPRQRQLRSSRNALRAPGAAPRSPPRGRRDQMADG